MKTYNDNYWYIYRNSGVPLRLVAGPNELRGRNFKPWTRGTEQLFYFRKDLPGTTHLVLEQSYWSKPMILKVVDGPPPPPRAPAPPPPPPMVKSEKVVLRGAHFDFDKSNIRPGDAAVLDEDVEKLKATPNVSVSVNGYCDAIGTEEYNLRLSDRRADAVVNYLVRAGIPSSQLVPHGYGKTNFVATNDTEEGRAQNRRVELVPNE
jgi:outer membrane protein OmpA-like peptidoglycan-associated protein